MDAQAGVVLDTASTVTAELVRGHRRGGRRARRGSTGIDAARQLFEQVALADDFADFLTLPAYELID